MTQTTLLSLCRLEVPEINSTDVISDANLLIILNLACTEFIKETDALPTSATFNLVLNLTEYPLSTYVTGFGKIRKEGLWIYNASTLKWTQLESTTVSTLNLEFPSWLNTAAGFPQRFSLNGDILTLHPKASSTYAGSNYLKLFHYARSTDMSASGHYPFSGSTTQYSHLAQYEETLVDYVCYKAKKMIDKNSDAEEARTMFYVKCGKIKQELQYRPDLISEMRAKGAGGIAAAKGAFST